MLINLVYCNTISFWFNLFIAAFNSWMAPETAFPLLSLFFNFKVLFFVKRPLILFLISLIKSYLTDGSLDEFSSTSYVWFCDSSCCSSSSCWMSLPCIYCSWRCSSWFAISNISSTIISSFYSLFWLSSWLSGSFADLCWINFLKNAKCLYISACFAFTTNPLLIFICIFPKFDRNFLHRLCTSSAYVNKFDNY